MKILVIDPLFEQEPDIELAIAGQDMELYFRRSVDGKLENDADYTSADAVLNCRSAHRMPASIIDKLVRCRVIQQGGVGYGHLDLVAAARRGIPVLNTPNYGTTEVADHSVALALNLLRGIQAYDRRLRRSNVDARSLKIVRRLPELRVGIVGLGRIGTAAALRFKAFGMQVGFYDPYLPVGHELALGFERFETLDALLRRSDVLSVHALLNAETKHMIDAKALALLPPGAILVNTSRGGIVNFHAVREALESGALGAAGLDVFETEPIDRSDPLIVAWMNGAEWLDERLILTPHAAFYSDSSLDAIRRLSMKYLTDYLRSGEMRTCVNEALLKQYAPAASTVIANA